MTWRALVRVVDFQEILTAQAILSDAIAGAIGAHGPRSDEVRALREGYNVIAKVLWTRRAGIPEVHDLAWLDHAVVAPSRQRGRTWGDADRATWASLAASLRGGVLADLLPRRDTASWCDVHVDTFGGEGFVKLERGVAGPYQVGIVVPSRFAALTSELATLRAEPRSVAVGILEDLKALAAAARASSGGGVALVFAASAAGTAVE